MRNLSRYPLPSPPPRAYLRMWLSGPSGYKDLDLLCLCASYSCTWSQKIPRAFFFQEHRMAVPVVYAALTDGVFGKSKPLLVRIDGHTDYADDRVPDYGDKRERIKTIEDCILFANALPDDDGSWVEPVLRLGWITDAVNLVVYPLNLHNFKSPLVDLDGRTHRSFAFPDLSEPPPDLGSGIIELDPQPLQSLITTIGAASTGKIPGQQPAIWFDIDLDFAVQVVNGDNNRAYSPEELVVRLSKPIACVNLPQPIIVRDLVSKLIANASLLTIASEPAFSGGFAGVDRILAGMRLAFPEHAMYFNWFNKD